jgi:hypothetical protein
MTKLTILTLRALVKASPAKLLPYSHPCRALCFPQRTLLAMGNTYVFRDFLNQSFQPPVPPLTESNLGDQTDKVRHIIPGAQASATPPCCPWKPN